MPEMKNLYRYDIMSAKTLVTTVQFDYYVRAFPDAGRTVDYRLRHEQAALYPAWRMMWNASLTPEENSLIKFMVDDRITEAHASGSRRRMGAGETSRSPLAVRIRTRRVQSKPSRRQMSLGLISLRSFRSQYTASA